MNLRSYKLQDAANGTITWVCWLLTHSLSGAIQQQPLYSLFVFHTRTHASPVFLRITRKRKEGNVHYKKIYSAVLALSMQFGTLCLETQVMHGPGNSKHSREIALILFSSFSSAFWRLEWAKGDLPQLDSTHPGFLADFIPAAALTSGPRNTCTARHPAIPPNSIHIWSPLIHELQAALISCDFFIKHWILSAHFDLGFWGFWGWGFSLLFLELISPFDVRLIALWMLVSNQSLLDRSTELYKPDGLSLPLFTVSWEINSTILWKANYRPIQG